MLDVGPLHFLCALNLMQMSESNRMFLVCIKFSTREVLHFKKGVVLTLFRCLVEKGVQIKEILVPKKFNSHVER